MADSTGTTEAFMVYLKQKGDFLQKMLGLYEQVLEALQSDREEEIVNLLEAVNRLERQVDDLDEQNSQIRSLFHSPEATDLPGEEGGLAACKSLNERNLQLIRDSQELVRKIKALAQQKQEEFGRQLKLLGEGKKVSNAYSGGPQLIEGVFIDLKK